MTRPRTSLDDMPCTRLRPKVRVRRYPVDWADPVSAPAARATAILKDKRTWCVYVNPMVTITCDEPTTEFFAEVCKRQAEWCRLASQTIPKRVRRRVSAWVAGGEMLANKAQRYFHRAFCYTGVLFIDGALCPPGEFASRIGAKAMADSCDAADPRTT